MSRYTANVSRSGNANAKPGGIGPILKPVRYFRIDAKGAGWSCQIAYKLLKTASQSLAQHSVRSSGFPIHGLSLPISAQSDPVVLSSV